MRLSMKDRRALTRAFAQHYQNVGAPEKTRILNEFVRVTGYHRVHAARALRTYREVRRAKHQRPSRVVYGPDVCSALHHVWGVLDYVCGKRLVAAIPDIVPRLETCGEFKLPRATREKLLRISAATADRLLAPARRQRGRAQYRKRNPASYLFSRIPIKTFGEWKNAVPGQVEMDLVAHNGGDARGGFLSTLNMTDVATGWTVCRVVPTKSEFQVLKALYRLRTALPFPLRAIDTDNGPEFINGLMVAFCDRYKIEFTRSRPYKKNDSCFIEQKNHSVIRKNVGYFRYDAGHARIIAQLYGLLNVYANFFQPVMMLESKTRQGAKTYRKYDRPRTPYQRLIERAVLTRIERRRLAKLLDGLNPAELRRNIDRLQLELIALAPERKRRNLAGPRRRRPKRVSHTSPALRRDDPIRKANPFLERLYLEGIRNAMRSVWNLREKIADSS